MSGEVLTPESSALRAEVKSSEDTFLSDDLLRQLISIGEIDILVGLPTHNNAETVGSVVSAIQDAILQWFPRQRAAIINTDAGSRDNTPELVASASIDDVTRRASSKYALRTFHSITTQYGNNVARGTALRTILAAAELLRARVCAVISPESTGLKPEWIGGLLQPVYRQQCDLVLPTYTRHKFEGLLITNLLYPMMRALYGLRIREPYAQEFAFSGQLASHFLLQNSWNDDSAREGCEMRFVIAAIRDNYRIGQSFCGVKPHIERHASDLVPALRLTLGELFGSMEANFPFWSTVTGSRPVPCSDTEHRFALDNNLRVNRKRLWEMFRMGVGQLQSVFNSILLPDTLQELQALARVEEAEFRYSEELWAKTVYEFAAAYRKAVISRDHIIQALAPLFRGRAFTFLLENRNSSAAEVENHVESLCLEFERLKPYLLEIWKPRE